MLKAIQLGQQLTKVEMKNVKGGEGVKNQPCQVLLKGGKQSVNLTLAEAKDLLDNGFGTRYCCASCDTASWSWKG
jgi:hypothetical protein